MKDVNELLFTPYSFGGESEPNQLLAIASTSASGMIQHGVWECGPGEMDLHFEWDETVFGLQGSAEVHNIETGEGFILGPGSMGFFAKGSHWRWKISRNFKKVFTIVS
jgi:uncharacterized cupin superfamily protein